MGHMERDVVNCPQNAMFVLPRKMLKILYQLWTGSTSVRNEVYIMPVYVDAKNNTGSTYNLPFLQCTIVVYLLAKNIKSKLQLY